MIPTQLRATYPPIIPILQHPLVRWTSGFQNRNSGLCVRKAIVRFKASLLPRQSRISILIQLHGQPSTFFPFIFIKILKPAGSDLPLIHPILLVIWLLFEFLLLASLRYQSIYNSQCHPPRKTTLRKSAKLPRLVHQHTEKRLPNPISMMMTPLLSLLEREEKVTSARDLVCDSTRLSVLFPPSPFI